MLNKQTLLNKIIDAQERLNFVADGQNEIGNLCIIVSQLADVLAVVVRELPTDEPDAGAWGEYQHFKKGQK